MTEYAHTKYHRTTHEKVNNMCSGMFNSTLNFGNALGSLTGSLLNSKIGFRLTSDVVGMSILIVGLIYFLTTNSIEAFK